MKRYVILAEGAFDEEAKTATGVMRYAQSPTVAVIDSTRAGTVAGDHVPGLKSDVPVVSDARRHVGARADDAPGRRRAGGRQAARRLSPRDPRRAGERPRRRERPARFPGRRPRVRLGRPPFGPGAARPAPGAARPERADRGEPRRADAHRPHGRVGLRPRQDDGVPRARRRGAPARPGVGVRPDRADGHRHRRVGDRGRRGDLGLRRRRRPSGWSWRATSAAATARSCGSRARARSTTRSTRASPSGCCTAPPRTLSSSCTSRAGETIDGDPRYAIPTLTELIDDQVRMARHVRPAAGRRRRRSRRTGSTRTPPARRSSETERETGLVADDPVRFGAGRLLDAVHERAPLTSRAVPDPRVTRLAEVLCRYSLEIGPGDTVLIDGPALAQPLFVEMVKLVTEAGAHPMLRPRLERADAALLEGASEAQVAAITRLDEVEIEAPTQRAHDLGKRQHAPHEQRAVPRPRRRGRRRCGPLFERFLARESAGDVRWCGTAFPCNAAAQDAGMSLADWEDFVYRAGHLNDADPIAFWREQSARQAKIAERFAGRARDPHPGRGHRPRARRRRPHVGQRRRPQELPRRRGLHEPCRGRHAGPHRVQLRRDLHGERRRRRAPEVRRRARRRARGDTRRATSSSGCSTWTRARATWARWRSA